MIEADIRKEVFVEDVRLMEGVGRSEAVDYGGDFGHGVFHGGGVSGVQLLKLWTESAVDSFCDQLSDYEPTQLSLRELNRE